MSIQICLWQGFWLGTEGYLESSATGWLAGSNAARQALGLEPLLPPETTMLGGLVRYLATANPENFQPMNANWGLVPTLPKQKREGKKERRMRTFERGQKAFQEWIDQQRVLELQIT